MPEMTLQEKRLSLGTHHFKLLLLQWLWKHLFLKGLCLRCTNNNVLIFTFIQRLDILVLPTTNHSPFQQKATDQEKRKEKTNPSTPKPLNLPCQVQRWASLTLICVILLRQQWDCDLPFHSSHKPIMNWLGHLFHLHTDQHNFLHSQGVTEPSLLLLRNCERHSRN